MAHNYNNNNNIYCVLTPDYRVYKLCIQVFWQNNQPYYAK